MNTSPWNGVVRACAAGSAAVAIARGLAVGDRESIGIGLLLVIAEILTHTRLARVGWLGLTALFVNQGFWMITAIISLTNAAPSLAGALAPATLSTTAVLGLIGSLVRLRTSIRRGARTLGMLGAASVVVLAVGVPVLGHDAARTQKHDLAVVTRDVAFKPTRLYGRSGDGRVAVVVKNDDLFWHTFTVNRLNLSVRVPTGGRRRLDLGELAPGTYKFVCAIPGHEQAGMRGTLVVRPLAL